MKNIVITGAFGGMGLETSKLFASKGFKIYAIDRKTYIEGENIIPIKADLTDEESVKEAFLKVKETAESIDAIIHFAGIYMLDSLVEMDTADFERIVDINFKGAFLINKHFLPLLKENSRIIITTSELAPLWPLPFTGIYAVTKAALEKYAYSLSMELQLKKIKVSVLRAGAVSTNMLGVSTAALDRFVEKTELYSCNAQRFKKIVESVEARSVRPEKAARKVERIFSKKNPAFAYKLNRNPLLLMLNLLPKRLQLFAIKLVLK